MSSTYFTQCLTECGLLSSSDSLTCQRRLESRLRCESTRIGDFIEGFDEWIDINHCKALLTPLGGATSVRGHAVAKADTLLKVLLRIELLQEQLFTLVIHKIVDLAQTVNMDTNETSDIGNDDADNNLDICVLLLNHIRWCEVVYNPKILMTTLLDTTPSLCKTLQIDIISSLPGISTELDHDLLVKRLLGMMSNSPELIPCILECVYNLCLPPKSPLISDVITDAKQLLVTAEPVYLPSIIRSLLEFADSNTSTDIIDEIRNKFGEFLSIFSQFNEEEQRGAHLNAQTLILNILTSTFQAKPLLLTSFQQILDSHKEHNSALIVDLWILFALAGSLKLRGKVGRIMAKKYGNGSIGKDTIRNAIHGFGVALDCSFDAILALSQAMLSSVSRIGPIGPYAQDCASILYQEIYKEFATASKRQEIIAAIVSHAGSPYSREVDLALNILQQISSNEMNAINRYLKDPNSNSFESEEGTPVTPYDSSSVTLRSFIPFLKTLLEEIRNLTENQLRILFRVLFQCATCITITRYMSAPAVSATNSNIIDENTDEIIILLNKFAGNVDFKLQRIAIIGYVARLCQISVIPLMIPTISCDVCNKALMLMLRQVNDDSNMLIFLLDELSDNIEHGFLHNRSLITFLLSKIESSIIDLVGTGDAELQASKKHTKDKGIESELYYNVNEKFAYPTRSEGFMTVDDTNELEIQSGGSQVDRALFVRIVTGVIRNRTVSVYNDRFSASLSSSSSSSTSRTRFITDAIQSLSSYLRLASKCHVIIHNNLNEIDCFLGMPLELPCYSSLNGLGDYSESCQIDMLWSLKYAVDWLREVLNAFCYSGVVNKLLYGKLLFVMNKLLNAEDAMTQYAQQCVPFLRIMEVLDNDAQISRINDTKKQQGLFTALLKNWKAQNTKKKTTAAVTPEIPPNIKDIQGAFAAVYRKLHPYVCVLIGFGAHTPQSIHSSTNYLVGSILTEDSLTKLLELGVYHSQRLFDDEKTCIWSSNDVADQAPLHNLLSKWQQHGVFCSLSTTITMLGSHFNEMNQLQERRNGECMDLDDEVAVINEKIEGIWTNFNHILLIISVVVSSESLRQNAIASISFKQADETGSSSQSDNVTIVPLLFSILFNIACTSVTEVPVASICEVAVTGVIDLLLHILDIIRPNTISKKMNFDTVILVVTTIEKIISLMDKFPQLEVTTVRSSRHRFSEICEKLLVQQWSVEGMAKHVAVILRCRVEYSNSPLEAISNVFDETYNGAQIIVDQAEEIRVAKKKTKSDKISIHTNYPLLTTATFKSFFAVLFHILTDRMDATHHQILMDITQAKSQGVTLSDFSEHVDYVAAFVYKCRRLIKLHESDGLELVGIKSLVIKEGGKLVRVLLKHISIMSMVFDQHMEKILAIIADIQKITASLTKLFSDSKTSRNEADLKFIPAIKKDVEQILFKIKTMLLDAGCDPADCIEVGTVKSIPKKREQTREEKEIDFTGDSAEDSVVDGSDLDFLDGMEDDDVDIDDAPGDANDDNNDEDEEKSVSPVMKKRSAVVRSKKAHKTITADDDDDEEEVEKSIPPVSKKRPAVARTKKVPLPQESSEEQVTIPERRSRPVDTESRKKKRLAQYDTDDSDDGSNNENSPVKSVNTLIGTIEDSD